MTLRRIALVFLMFPANAAAEDVEAIVRRSLERDLRSVKALENYTFQEVLTENERDSSGKVKKTHSKVYEYFIVDGVRRRRLIEEDGKPVPPEKGREKRLVERENRSKEAQKLRKEVVSAYVFTLLGEETIAGAKCWKIQAEPRPGFQGTTRIGKYLNKMHGTFWISQTSYDWLRVEAETLDKITFGGFLASLTKGATFTMQQMRVNDELWHPEHFEVKFNARALMVRANIGVEGRYRNFKKFQTDSRIVDLTVQD